MAQGQMVTVCISGTFSENDALGWVFTYERPVNSDLSVFGLFIGTYEPTKCAYGQINQTISVCKILVFFSVLEKAIKILM